MPHIMHESRKFRQGEGVLKLFRGQHIHTGPHGPPSRSNWTQGFQLLLEGVRIHMTLESNCFSREVRTSIFLGTYSNLWFFRGAGSGSITLPLRICQCKYQSSLHWCHNFVKRSLAKAFQFVISWTQTFFCHQHWGSWFLGILVLF